MQDHSLEIEEEASATLVDCNFTSTYRSGLLIEHGLVQGFRCRVHSEQSRGLRIEGGSADLNECIIYDCEVEQPRL